MAQLRVTVSSKFRTKFAIKVHAAVSEAGAIFFGIDSPVRMAFAAALASF
jgi:hypothetical protein